LDEFAVIGRLHKFWSWADAHSVDGTVCNVSPTYIDRLVAHPGFADQLIKVGWLRARCGHLELPGWSSHNGLSAKARAGEAARKRAQRMADPTENVRTFVRKKSGPEKRREENMEAQTRDNRPATARPVPPVPPDASEKNGTHCVQTPDLPTWLSQCQLAGIPAPVAEEIWHDNEGRGCAPDGHWIDHLGQPIANPLANAKSRSMAMQQRRKQPAANAKANGRKWQL
jgi:hypothetical protein